MGEKREKSAWGKKDFRRKWPETKVDFPVVPYPDGSRITVKAIAYLHSYCRQTPAEIVARYPRAMTLAHVHLALFHYFTNKEAIDSELAKEIRFNARDTLGDASMTLPSVGLASL